MNQKPFASWWRGEVYLLQKNWIKTIKKQAKSATHKGVIYKEAQILKFIAKQNLDFVPQILDSGEDRFEQQFVDGQPLQKVYSKANLPQKKQLLLQLVDIAYQLDKAWVVHWEISRPFKNFLVDSQGKIRVIDFERGHLFDTEWKNLRWVMQFLLSQWIIDRRQAQRLGQMRNLDEIHRLLRWYIKTYPYHQFIEWSWLLVVLILLDRFTKTWFTTQLNKWSSFGIEWFSNQLLIALGFVVLIVLGRWAIQKKMPLIPTIFLIAGIVGNTIDRILFEGVRDWLNWWFFTNNLADIWLSIGIVRLARRFVKNKKL